MRGIVRSLVMNLALWHGFRDRPVSNCLGERLWAVRGALADAAEGSRARLKVSIDVRSVFVGLEAWA